MRQHLEMLTYWGGTLGDVIEQILALLELQWICSDTNEAQFALKYMIA